tara:strand:- start:376 stop:1515 length:1140 start_codon:yes stop_codon:yes gene_type:complete
MKLISLFITVLCIAFYSCSEERTEDPNILPAYEFELIDSIQINHLGSLELLDVHVEKELYLFSTENDNHLFLTNKSGEIVSKFDEPVDSPKAFGNGTGSGIFFENQIVIMGYNQFAVYDLEFNFKHGFKLTYPGSDIFYANNDHLKRAFKNKKPMLLAFTGGPQNGVPSNQPEYYTEYNAFDLIDVDSGTFTPVVPFHPKSRFLSGKAFGYIQPKYHVEGNDISFIYSQDTLLFHYNLDQPETFTATRIPFDNFIINEGFRMKGQMDYETPSDVEGKIHTYFKVGDLNLIAYTSGIKHENIPDLTQEEDVLVKEFARINPLKWILLNDSGKSSNPQEMQSKFYITRVDSDGNFWAKQNTYMLEEESDLITYYKLKLVQK